MDRERSQIGIMHLYMAVVTSCDHTWPCPRPLGSIRVSSTLRVTLSRRFGPSVSAVTNRNQRRQTLSESVWRRSVRAAKCEMSGFAPSKCEMSGFAPSKCEVSGFEPSKYAKCVNYCSGLSRCTACSRAARTVTRLLVAMTSQLACTHEPTVIMCGARRPDNGHMEFGHSANMGTPSAGVYIFSFRAACK